MGKAAKILVIDDEPSILKLVTAYLQPEGFEVETASDGETGLKKALALHPDLIVLDVMLPGMDGMELLTRLRREAETYVIMLTARTEETDKVVGLSLGADDYVTKPFSPRELVARIKAALRRMQSISDESRPEVYQYPHITLNASTRQVWVEGQAVTDLTATEFDLVKTLMEHRGMVLSREQLLQKVWGYEYFGDARVVDVHIGHARQKLGEREFLHTIRGIGYRFDDRED